MKKKIQILTILIIFLLSLFISNNVFAANTVTGGNTGGGNRVNTGASSTSPTQSSSGGSSTYYPGSGSNGNRNTIITNQGSTGSGSNGNRNTVINNRPSTGIDLNGKDAQTSVPSGSVNPDNYEPKDLTVSDAGDFIDIANSIIGAIRIFGTVVAVVALMALGLKYMLGSVQDKATYKETMIPYLIGAVMVFAIPNVIGIILDLVSQIKF